MKLEFTKMHGLGNDFVLIDNRELNLKRATHIAKKLCDRRLGIGADQLLLLSNSESADFKMRIFNADGSEVEMCGNGIRCLGKYIWDSVLRCDESSYASKYCETIGQLAIETLAGIMYVEKKGNRFKVDMGEPALQPDEIPVNTSLLPKKLREDAVQEFPLKIKRSTISITCVSMGNPHAISIVRNVDDVALQTIGPLIECHKFFPNRTNVEFVQVLNKKNIRMRVWERGAGETTACGTGAAASAVAAIILGLTERKVTVHLPGGKLLIHWSAKDNHIYMTGDAVTVFEGVLNI